MLLTHCLKILLLHRWLGVAALSMALVDALLASGALGPLLQPTSSWVWGLIVLRGLSSALFIGLTFLASWALPKVNDMDSSGNDDNVDVAGRSLQAFIQVVLMGSVLFVTLQAICADTVSSWLMLSVPVFSAAFLARPKTALIRSIWMAALAPLLSLMGGMFNIPLGMLPTSTFLPLLSDQTVSNEAYRLESWLTLLPDVFLCAAMARLVGTLVHSSSHQVSRLQSMATTDALTGLINRRLFNLQLQGEWSRARRHHSALCLALFDVDNFKKINDTYGHTVGDRILKELAALVAHNLRDSDIPARYGGEEFALILTETRQMEAAELMERIRMLIERHVFCLPDNPLTVTVSIGVAQFDLKAHSRPEDLVGQADAALYEAKHQGKNRVIYGVLPVPKVSYRSSRSVASPPSVPIAPAATYRPTY